MSVPCPPLSSHARSVIWKNRANAFEWFLPGFRETPTTFRYLTQVSLPSLTARTTPAPATAGIQGAAAVTTVWSPWGSIHMGTTPGPPAVRAETLPGVVGGETLTPRLLGGSISAFRARPEPFTVPTVHPSVFAGCVEDTLAGRYERLSSGCAAQARTWAEGQRRGQVRNELIYG